MNSTPPADTRRPAWVEIDVARWRRNLAIIRSHLPAQVAWIAVIKDDAYGHGALLAARLATESEAAMLAVSNLDEALELRAAGVRARLLLLGERHPGEFARCVAHDITCCVGNRELLEPLAAAARRAGRRIPLHLKVNTGMNRYGVAWTTAGETVALIEGLEGQPLRVEGIFSHFAMSDETDKTFAQLQQQRFHDALRACPIGAGPRPLRHLCNSGGFLDLPEAHLDAVRLGILPLGVYPSAVCRRLPGIEPVMSVKARISTVRSIQAGESVGYGLRYTAPARREIAILPLGYGDGFPRVRNAGHVLLRGRRAPIIGGVSMDAVIVDVSDVPGAQAGDTVVLLGRDQQEEISVHDLARLKQSVSYDILCGWRRRLPRVLVNEVPSTQIA